jgi:circadian clock protein KaiC
METFLYILRGQMHNLSVAVIVAERVPSGVEGLDEVIGGGFPRGSLILLAGNPGTGKTVFSAQFLVKGAESGELGVYVSFAEDKNVFFKNLSKHLGCDLKRLEEKGELRFLDLVAMKAEGVSANIDAILNEVQSIKAKRLVVDSFTALAQAFEDPLEVRTIIHTILSKLIRQMGCTTVITEEVPVGESRIGLGLEEFVADIVMKLEAKEFNGRLLRDLTLIKARGTEVAERRLLFTLKNGFKVFPPFKPKPISKPSRFWSTPDPLNSYSSGSKDLDEMLGGGYPKGASILLEAAGKVSTSEYHLILLPTMLNFAAHGRAVIITPTAGIDAEVAKREALEYGATEDEVNRLLRVCEPRTLSRDQSKPYIAVLEGKDIQKDYEQWLRLEEELAQNTGQPVLAVTGLDTLTSFYGPDACEYILRMDATRIRSHNTIAFGVAKPSVKQLVGKVSAIADVHLRITREHGALLLYGVKPRIALHVVETDVSKGYPIPQLTPIV